MKQKINELITELNSGLIEREPHIKEALLTMLAGENLLLVGPPGTAKSEIARRLTSVIQDGNYFEYLLTKFTTPEELFGPYSIEEMKNDKLKRKVDSYLPTSNIAFLDETFKGSSAILNTLLEVMNEKSFKNDAKTESLNLLSVIGATNELPKESKELEPLYDRFLTRMFIDYVSEENRLELLLSENKKFDGISIKNRFKVEELQKFHKDIERVKLSAENGQIIVNIDKELKERFNDNDFETVTDRRFKKALRILKASALSNERDEVNVLDISLLSNIFWSDDANREEVEKIVLSNLPTADSQKASKMNYLYEKQFQKFEELGISGDTAQERNEQGQPLFLDRDGKKTTDSEREYDDSKIKNMHLQKQDGKYIYINRYYNLDFLYSTQKYLSHPDEYDSELVYTTSLQGQIVPAKKENGEYIYLFTDQQETHQDSKSSIKVHYIDYNQVSHKVQVPNVQNIKHEPSIKALRFFTDDLEILSQQTSDKLPEVQKIFDEIKANRDDIANSLQTHLWIDSQKLSFIGDSVEKDLEEATKILDSFIKLKDTVELYYKKAVEDRENYKKSLQNG
jgi:MoxR-like ATPase